MTQRPNETAMEYLRRATYWLSQNAESVLDDLPRASALLELFDLISDIYDVSLLDEVYEAIDYGASPEPLRAFIRKYQLPWNTAEKNE